MKQLILLCLSFVLLTSCGSGAKVTSDKTDKAWSSFNYPEINFINKASNVEGGKIYDQIVPQPNQLINESILGVVKTLYWNLSDSIPNITKIN